MNGMIRLEEIDLYVTEKCNLNCEFCSVKANEREQKELPKEKLFEIIDSAKEMGLEQLHLTGGEPTLRKDLEEIIEYAVKKHIEVRLITNGTLMDKQRISSLVESGLKNIMVSIDGMESYHDNIRGSGTFQKAVNCVKLATSFEGLIVRVNSVAWKDNRDEIFKLIKFVDSIGVDVYSIFLGSPLGRGKKMLDNVLNMEEYKKFTEDLENYLRENRSQLVVTLENGYIFDDDVFSRENLKGRGVGCYQIEQGNDYFLVRGDGEIYPCVFFANEGESIGNINKNSLQDIVKSFKTNNFYCKVGTIPPACLSCKNVNLCKGGCRGYAKIYFDQWEEKDPRCCGIDANSFPVCPIMKKNMNTMTIGGSSEQVIKKP